jgi:hypothetical protein
MIITMSFRVKGSPWISKVLPGYPRFSLDIQGSPWISKVLPGYPRFSLDIQGSPWINIEDFPWIEPGLFRFPLSDRFIKILQSTYLICPLNLGA